MPTDPAPSAQAGRFVAARDEALRRYTQHLAAIQLKNSRWCAMLSRGRPAARGSLWSATGPKALPHAH
ncbi:hypothetical protein [Opitutus sp. GAS368]|jgi:hypothetical protein|uniref:hypothetical protein n=1 Tax=Opitutus sp. GAS368 TaxID=1882749 RepID=UPI00087B51FC|nr:hypothetical protein [Opitutus sp. GAS368]SDR67120.1 hypothetical protein SAMN05444173_0271 [Opitutus sp. GAS368]